MPNFIDMLVDQLGTPKESDNDYRFNCPFCDEGRQRYKMYVSKDHGYFHCFNCGQHGSLAYLLSKVNRVSIKQGITLAHQYGNTFIHKSFNTNLSPEEQLLSSLLADEQLDEVPVPTIMTLKPAPFVQGYRPLANDTSPVARPFWQYCRKRGFSPKIVQDYRIGYVTYGAYAMPNGKVRTIKHSLVFPTFDKTGQCIYWNTRSIEPNPVVKSINAPEFDGCYSKKNCIFNFNNAINQPLIVITEGVPDAITLGLCGVGTFGKQVTDAQVQLLLDNIKPEQKVLIMLDMDAVSNIQSLANRIYPYHHETYVIANPTNEDANDLGYVKAWDVIAHHLILADEKGMIELNLR